MVVDKHTIIGLKDDEIRIDFVIEVSNMLIKLKKKAFSQSEYDKVNEMAKVIINEFNEMETIIKNKE